MKKNHRKTPLNLMKKIWQNPPLNKINEEKSLKRPLNLASITKVVNILP